MPAFGRAFFFHVQCLRNLDTEHRNRMLFRNVDKSRRLGRLESPNRQRGVGGPPIRLILDCLQRFWSLTCRAFSVRPRS